MSYSQRDMKWMALGEIGAFVVGLAVAIFAVMFFSDLITPMKIAVFLAAWFQATKLGLWFIHLGYDPKANQTS